MAELNLSLTRDNVATAIHPHEHIAEQTSSRLLQECKSPAAVVSFVAGSYRPIMDLLGEKQPVSDKDKELEILSFVERALRKIPVGFAPSEIEAIIRSEKTNFTVKDDPLHPEICANVTYIIHNPGMPPGNQNQPVTENVHANWSDDFTKGGCYTFERQDGATECVPEFKDKKDGCYYYEDCDEKMQRVPGRPCGGSDED